MIVNVDFFIQFLFICMIVINKLIFQTRMGAASIRYETHVSMFQCVMQPWGHP